MNPDTTTVQRGSEWHRWEPHIHAPGTILNDRYKGANAWELYVDALEKCTPALRGIGVTDYCSIDSYKRLKHIQENQHRLENCLLFPNVELRLNLGTKKGNHVNIHLLVNPEDADHIAELERFLSRLTFSAHGDHFVCTPADLMRLGRKHDLGATEDRVALEKGTNQFKVSLDDLLTNYNAIGWAKENILIAVAGGADGTSGVQEAADSTLRQEVEKAANAIFASSPKQREFWLGRGGHQRRSQRLQNECGTQRASYDERPTFLIGS